MGSMKDLAIAQANGETGDMNLMPAPGTRLIHSVRLGYETFVPVAAELHAIRRYSGEERRGRSAYRLDLLLPVSDADRLPPAGTHMQCVVSGVNPETTITVDLVMTNPQHLVRGLLGVSLVDPKDAPRPASLS